MAVSTPHPTPVPVANVSAHTEQQQTPREHSGISAPEAGLLGAVISSFIVACGWVVVHYLNLKREREARAHSDKRELESKRADLLSLLRLWEQKFVVLSPEAVGQLYYHGGGMSEIASATEKFRPYVADKTTFDRLNVISGMDPPTMDADGSRRETVCGAIRALFAFVREA